MKTAPHEREKPALGSSTNVSLPSRGSDPVRINTHCHVLTDLLVSGLEGASLPNLSPIFTITTSHPGRQGISGIPEEKIAELRSLPPRFVTCSRFGFRSTPGWKGPTSPTDLTSECKRRLRRGRREVMGSQWNRKKRRRLLTSSAVRISMTGSIGMRQE